MKDSNRYVNQIFISNMDAEYRCDYLVTAEIKALWNIQIQMSSAILEICKKYDLKIWAISGTMLGAVRHKGFIPWDDDIDFMMFREDYDKLVKIAPRELSKPYSFQCAYTEEGYYRGHAQVRYDNTTMILPSEGVLGFTFHQGIFIDIFVADGLPEDKVEKDNLINTRNIILNYLWCRKYWRKKYLSLSNLIQFYKCKKKLGEMAQWDDVKLYSYLEDLFRAHSVSNCKYSCALLFGYLPRWVRITEMFDETIWVPFENVLFPIPARYDEILKIEYGDYMEFVKGTSYHGHIILNTETSYIKYLPKLKRNFFKMTYYFVRSSIGEIFRKLKLRN